MDHDVRLAQRGTSTTRLSHRAVAGRGIPAVPGRLARPSHSLRSVIPLAWAVSAGVAATGCVLANPPDVQPPGQTPPILDSADPLTEEIVGVRLDSSATSVPFRVRVRSEDLGQKLNSFRVFNYKTALESAFTDGPRPDASTLDDKTRFISFNVSVSELKLGCQQLTLLVTHQDNALGDGKFVTTDDVAAVTWWIDAYTSGTLPTDRAKLASCPQPTTTTGG